MIVSSIDSYEITRLRSDHAALRFEWELIKCAHRDRKFRVDQLRVPSGEPGAGRFADEGRKRPKAQPVFFNSLAAKTIEAGIALYLALSNRNASDSQAIITFNAKEFQSGGDGALDVDNVASLSRDDVNAACPRLGEVQQRTDTALDIVRATRGDLRPADFGTAVHTNLRDQIKDLGDPNFRAEVSYWKNEEGGYGKKDSIRIDVLERVGEGTVCVYDIKTGQSRLRIGRIQEIAKNVFRVYPDTNRIVVTEVRPTR